MAKKKVMFSGRFDGGAKEKYLRETADELAELPGIEVLVVQANAGQQFGPQTMRYLRLSDFVVAMMCERYGEQTESPYCTAAEVKYCIDNKKRTNGYPVLPIRLYEGGVWPPAPCETAADQNTFLFTKDTVWVEAVKEGRRKTPKELAEIISEWVRTMVAEEAKGQTGGAASSSSAGAAPATQARGQTGGSAASSSSAGATPATQALVQTGGFASSSSAGAAAAGAAPATQEREAGELLEEPIAATRKKDLKLYVKNIAPDTRPEDLERYFGKYGPVVNVYVKRQEDGTSRFAIVTFRDEEAWDAALADGSHVIDGRDIVVKQYIRNYEAYQLYVGRLHPETNREDLQQHFTGYGRVVDVDLQFKEEDRRRGFAFVSFAEKKARDAALGDDSHVIRGRRVDVNLPNTEVRREGVARGGSRLFPGEDKLILALSPDGSLQVQRMLDRATGPQLDSLVDLLVPHLAVLYPSSSGKDVLEKIIKVVPVRGLQPIVAQIEADDCCLAMAMAKHAYGCRAVDTLLKRCMSIQQALRNDPGLWAKVSRLADKYIAEAEGLSQHECGQVVVLRVIELCVKHGEGLWREALVERLLPNLPLLAMHDTAKEVVRHLLKNGSLAAQRRIAAALVAAPSFEELVDSPSGCVAQEIANVMATRHPGMKDLLQLALRRLRAAPPQRRESDIFNYVAKEFELLEPGAAAAAAAAADP